jgi:hypothetical protein
MNKLEQLINRYKLERKLFYNEQGYTEEPDEISIEQCDVICKKYNLIHRLKSDFKILAGYIDDLENLGNIMETYKINNVPRSKKRKVDTAKINDTIFIKEIIDHNKNLHQENKNLRQENKKLQILNDNLLNTLD